MQDEISNSPVLRELLAHEGMRDEEARDLVDLVGIPEADQDALASGVGTAFLGAFRRLYERRALDALRAIEREEAPERVLAGARLWQALRAVTEDLEYFPSCCRQALQYTKSSEAGEEAPEEDDF